MELETERHDETLLIKVIAERIDAAAALEFKESMRNATAEGPHHVILDLGMVAFIDSSGLGAVVAVLKQINSEGKMELCALTPTVQKLFKLTRLDSIFVVHDSPESALKAA